MARDFRKIAAWRRAHELTLAVYRATGGFPDQERYGLVSQMRRACASIPTNIAEVMEIRRMLLSFNKKLRS